MLLDISVATTSQHHSRIVDRLKTIRITAGLSKGESGATATSNTRSGATERQEAAKIADHIRAFEIRRHGAASESTYSAGMRRVQ